MTPCSVVMLEEYLVMGLAAMMLGPLAVAGGIWCHCCERAAWQLLGIP
jgi:hypothetical protein